MTLKEAIEKISNLSTHELPDETALDTVLAAARDMLVLGEAYKKYTLHDTVQADYDRQLFKYTAANLAQKWGG